GGRSRRTHERVAVDEVGEEDRIGPEGVAPIATAKSLGCRIPGSSVPRSILRPRKTPPSDSHSSRSSRLLRISRYSISRARPRNVSWARPLKPTLTFLIVLYKRSSWKTSGYSGRLTRDPRSTGIPPCPRLRPNDSIPSSVLAFP